MRAVGVAGITGERAFDGREGAGDIAGFKHGEGMHAAEPPIVAVVVGEVVEQLQQVRLTPGASAEPDQPERAGAGRQHHGIARVLPQVFAGGGERARAVAVDEAAESQRCDSRSRAGSVGASSRARADGCARFGATHVDLQDAGETDVRQGKPLVRRDRPLKGLFGAFVGGQQQIDADNISVASPRPTRWSVRCHVGR